MKRVRSRRDPITPEEAREAQAFANREGTPEAFEVAADAWEEAGRLKQAERMRWRANELHVADAAERLERALESAAAASGSHEYGKIEPRGDFWLSELDDSWRGRSIRINVPSGLVNIFDISRERYFEGYINKSDHGWSGGYQFRPWRGIPEGFVELDRERSSVGITKQIVQAYREAIELRRRRQ